MGGELYFLLEGDWVVSPCSLLAACRSVCVCFQSPLLFCCVHSSVWVWFLQAVRNPVGWKLYPEPWVLSSHGNQLPGWLQTFFWCSYLQSLRILLIYEPILMNIKSVTSGRWRKYLVQSRDKYAEFSPSWSPFGGVVYEEQCSTQEAAGPRVERCPVNEARYVSDCSQSVLCTPQSAEQMALGFTKSGKKLWWREVP